MPSEIGASMAAADLHAAISDLDQISAFPYDIRRGDVATMATTWANVPMNGKRMDRLHGVI
jgi:hypothetical protein